MFAIRRLHDLSTPANRDRLQQVQSILRAQFPGLDEADVQRLPGQLTDPLMHRFRSVVYTAENSRDQVRGFALLCHAPDLNFCFLDFVSAGLGETGRGIGGALYDRVREDAVTLGVIGIFLECLPDDPVLSPDRQTRAQNAARLRFYERYGARPIINTAYETPLHDGATDPPYLVFDSLGRTQPLLRRQARRIVRAILERKYADACPAAYVEHVVASFHDAEVQLRAPVYVKLRTGHAAAHRPRLHGIALIVNERHDIHHVRERGYVESPVRIKSIVAELDRSDLFERLEASRFPIRWIEAVHERQFVQFLKRATQNVPPGKSVYPYVFPIRNRARPPKSYPLRAGYYCIDTFTPLNENAYKAAIGAVDCALSGARCLLDGWALAYALVRPPGHHAERAAFGGFCYFNSAAVAAHYLSRWGRVAVLDIDYHHGNGTQDIFYRRNDVLTISIHGHPRVTYPYFSGFENETGEEAGTGFNSNFPLAESIGADVYAQALATAIGKIEKFAPNFLVVSLGLDTVRGDPTGSWLLGARDLHVIGRRIGAVGLPTLIVQEGGYRTRTLGTNARNFFQGLWNGHPAGSARHDAQPGT